MKQKTIPDDMRGLLVLSVLLGPTFISGEREREREAIHLLSNCQMLTRSPIMVTSVTISRVSVTSTRDLPLMSLRPLESGWTSPAR